MLPYWWLSVLDASGRNDDSITSLQNTHKRVWALFPTFDATGIIYSPGLCIWLEVTIVFPPPQRTSDFRCRRRIHVHGKFESTPSLIVDLAHEAETREPRTTYIASRLAAARCRMQSETGCVSGEDWTYFWFDTEAVVSTSGRLRKTGTS
jgi:hypothetical protein